MESQEKSKLFKFLRLDAIIEHLTGLIEARVELAKIEIKEEVSRIGARIIAGMFFAFLLVLIIILFSIAAGAWLNVLLDSGFVGYFIITGFYLLVLILLIVFKAHIWLQQKIESLLINSEGLEESDEQGVD